MLKHDNRQSTDICILGAGMVGLSIAYQILERYPALSVMVIEKESDVGMHSSGRNSGVLHAGLYYEPHSLKAKVCVAGAKRLREWCENERLPVMACGKVITPQKTELDSQLDILLERGQANGAATELIDEQQFHELVPDGNTASGRALWSPGTCVVKPILVTQRLKQQLQGKGVQFIFSQEKYKISPDSRELALTDNTKLSYGHLFNCAGLHADRIAHQYGVGNNYVILPFRGNYWQFKADAPLKFNTNLYPVPDLEVPFLGVHVTPSIDGETYLGPTATPALGRENYKGLQGVEPVMMLDFMRHMSTQLFMDKKMRRYVVEQAFDWLPGNFFDAARLIVPKIKMEHIKRSKKVGIRAQLYDRSKRKLVQDFVMLDGYGSTHVLNAISPAFTASFELADHILDNSEFSN